MKQKILKIKLKIKQENKTVKYIQNIQQKIKPHHDHQNDHNMVSNETHW